MTADELVERVARAVYEWRNRGLTNVWPWDDSGLDDEHPGVRDRMLSEARAAIRAVHEAMRQPSAEMQKQGGNALCMWVAPAMHADDAWRAMLAAHPIAEAARDE